MAKKPYEGRVGTKAKQNIYGMVSVVTDWVSMTIIGLKEERKIGIKKKDISA